MPLTRSIALLLGVFSVLAVPCPVPFPSCLSFGGESGTACSQCDSPPLFNQSNPNGGGGSGGLASGALTFAPQEEGVYSLRLRAATPCGFLFRNVAVNVWCAAIGGRPSVSILSPSQNDLCVGAPIVPYQNISILAQVSLAAAMVTTARSISDNIQICWCLFQAPQGSVNASISSSSSIMSGAAALSFKIPSSLWMSAFNTSFSSSTSNDFSSGSIAQVQGFFVPDVPGDYVIRISVRNKCVSSHTFLHIPVQPCNCAPVANAGTPSSPSYTGIIPFSTPFVPLSALSADDSDSVNIGNNSFGLKSSWSLISWLEGTSSGFAPHPTFSYNPSSSSNDVVYQFLSTNTSVLLASDIPGNNGVISTTGQSNTNSNNNNNIAIAAAQSAKQQATLSLISSGQINGISPPLVSTTIINIPPFNNLLFASSSSSSSSIISNINSALFPPSILVAMDQFNQTIVVPSSAAAAAVPSTVLIQSSSLAVAVLNGRTGTALQQIDQEPSSSSGAAIVWPDGLIATKIDRENYFNPLLYSGNGGAPQLSGSLGFGSTFVVLATEQLTTVSWIANQTLWIPQSVQNPCQLEIRNWTNPYKAQWRAWPWVSCLGSFKMGLSVEDGCGSSQDSVIISLQCNNPPPLVTLACSSPHLTLIPSGGIAAIGGGGGSGGASSSDVSSTTTTAATTPSPTTTAAAGGGGTTTTAATTTSSIVAATTTAAMDGNNVTSPINRNPTLIIDGRGSDTRNGSMIVTWSLDPPTAGVLVPWANETLGSSLALLANFTPSAAGVATVTLKLSDNCTSSSSFIIVTSTCAFAAPTPTLGQVGAAISTGNSIDMQVDLLSIGSGGGSLPGYAGNISAVALTFSWSFQGVPLPGRSGIIDVQTLPQLIRLPSAVTTMGGIYAVTVTATDGCSVGSISRSVRLLCIVSLSIPSVQYTPSWNSLSSSWIFSIVLPTSDPSVTYSWITSPSSVPIPISAITNTTLNLELFPPARTTSVSVVAKKDCQSMTVNFPIVLKCPSFPFDLGQPHIPSYLTAWSGIRTANGTLVGAWLPVVLDPAQFLRTQLVQPNNTLAWTVSPGGSSVGVLLSITPAVVSSLLNIASQFPALAASAATIASLPPTQAGSGGLSPILFFPTSVSSTPPQAPASTVVLTVNDFCQDVNTIPIAITAKCPILSKPILRLSSAFGTSSSSSGASNNNNTHMQGGNNNNNFTTTFRAEFDPIVGAFQQICMEGIVIASSPLAPPLSTSSSPTLTSPLWQQPPIKYSWRVLSAPMDSHYSLSSIFSSLSSSSNNMTFDSNKNEMSSSSASVADSILRSGLVGLQQNGSLLYNVTWQEVQRVVTLRSVSYSAALPSHPVFMANISSSTTASNNNSGVGSAVCLIPDLPGSYVFQMTASDGCTSSNSTIQLEASCPKNSLASSVAANYNSTPLNVSVQVLNRDTPWIIDPKKAGGGSGEYLFDGSSTVFLGPNSTFGNSSSSSSSFMFATLTVDLFNGSTMPSYARIKWIVTGIACAATVAQGGGGNAPLLNPRVGDIVGQSQVLRMGVYVAGWYNVTVSVSDGCTTLKQNTSIFFPCPSKFPVDSECPFPASNNGSFSNSSGGGSSADSTSNNKKFVLSDVSYNLVLSPVPTPSYLTFPMSPSDVPSWPSVLTLNGSSLINGTLSIVRLVEQNVTFTRTRAILTTNSSNVTQCNSNNNSSSTLNNSAANITNHNNNNNSVLNGSTVCNGNFSTTTTNFSTIAYINETYTNGTTMLVPLEEIFSISTPHCFQRFNFYYSWEYLAQQHNSCQIPTPLLPPPPPLPAARICNLIKNYSWTLISTPCTSKLLFANSSVLSNLTQQVVSSFTYYNQSSTSNSSSSFNLTTSQPLNGDEYQLFGSQLVAQDGKGRLLGNSPSVLLSADVAGTYRLRFSVADGCSSDFSEINVNFACGYALNPLNPPSSNNFTIEPTCAETGATPPTNIFGLGPLVPASAGTVRLLQRPSLRMATCPVVPSAPSLSAVNSTCGVVEKICVCNQNRCDSVCGPCNCTCTEVNTTTSVSPPANGTSSFNTTISNSTLSGGNTTNTGSPATPPPTNHTSTPVSTGTSGGTSTASTSISSTIGVPTTPMPSTTPSLGTTVPPSTSPPTTTTNATRNNITYTPAPQEEINAIGYESWEDEMTAASERYDQYISAVWAGAFLPMGSALAASVGANTVLFLKFGKIAFQGAKYFQMGIEMSDAPPLVRAAA